MACSWFLTQPFEKLMNTAGILHMLPWVYQGGGLWHSNSSDWTDELRRGFLPGSTGIRVADLSWQPAFESGTDKIKYWFAQYHPAKDIREKLGLPRTLHFRVFKND